MEELEDNALLINILLVLLYIIIFSCIVFMYTRIVKLYKKAHDLPSKIKYILGIVILPVVFLLFVYAKFKYF